MTTDNTTLYLRLLDEQTIETLASTLRDLRVRAVQEKRSEAAHEYAEALTQLTTIKRLPDLEKKLAEVWQARVNAFKIKPTSKTYTVQGEAYLTGVLATLTLLGYTTNERADMVAFFVQAGRMETILNGGFKL